MTTGKPDIGQWLTLTQAAEQLSVHPTTLRRWADNGDIPAMRTPGGHRRFAASDLKQFAVERSLLRRVSALEQHWMQQALSQTRREIVQQPDQSWLVLMDEQARQDNRMLGQRLLGLILQYLAGEETNGHILAEARSMGQEYGQLALKLGLPLTVALEASMFFRDSLMETALQLPETAHVQPETSLRLMRRVNELLNAVHLAIALVYDSVNEPAGQITETEG
jgi:excisionase family DNA binding protein